MDAPATATITEQDLDDVVAGVDEVDLSAADMRLLLLVTESFRAHGASLDALAAVRGKLRRALKALDAAEVEAEKGKLLEAPAPPVA